MIYLIDFCYDRLFDVLIDFCYDRLFDDLIDKYILLLFGYIDMFRFRFDISDIVLIYDY